jgi:hypothetical protein
MLQLHDDDDDDELGDPGGTWHDHSSDHERSTSVTSDPESMLAIPDDVPSVLPPPQPPPPEVDYKATVTIDLLTLMQIQPQAGMFLMDKLVNGQMSMTANVKDNTEAQEYFARTIRNLQGIYKGYVGTARTLQAIKGTQRVATISLPVAPLEADQVDSGTDVVVSEEDGDETAETTTSLVGETTTTATKAVDHDHHDHDNDHELASGSTGWRQR